AVFDPAGMNYATYELRAIATDAAGAIDPAPPVVQVRYTSLAMPAPPAAVRARAVGADVTVRWQASASEISHYRIEREIAQGSWLTVQYTSREEMEWTDVQRLPGPQRYRVFAFDV